MVKEKDDASLKHQSSNEKHALANENNKLLNELLRQSSIENKDLNANHEEGLKLELEKQKVGIENKIHNEHKESMSLLQSKCANYEKLINEYENISLCTKQEHNATLNQNNKSNEECAYSMLQHSHSLQHQQENAVTAQKLQHQNNKMKYDLLCDMTTNAKQHDEIKTLANIDPPLHEML